MLESTGPKPVSGKQNDPEDVCEGQDAAAPEYGDFGVDVVGHVPCPWRNWYYNWSALSSWFGFARRLTIVPKTHNAGYDAGSEPTRWPGRVPTGNSDATCHLERRLTHWEDRCRLSRAYSWSPAASRCWAGRDREWAKAQGALSGEMSCRFPDCICPLVSLRADDATS